MFDLRMLLRMILMVGAPLNLHERCPNCHKVKPSSGIEFSKTLVHLVGTQDEVHTSVQTSLTSRLQLRPLCGCIDLSYLKATNMVYRIAK